MPTLSEIQKPVLSLGSQGAEVKELQSLLNRYDFHIPENGVFDIQTQKVVKSFQLIMFLDTDGIVGDRTWRTLYAGAPVDMPVIRLGANQREVKFIQNILARLTKNLNEFTPYYIGIIDSIYGPKTESAVKEFQRNSGLVVDGVVGERTWLGLSKHGHLLYYVEEVATV